MSSSSSLTPARSSTLSSNSSVPTDLTVSSVSASTDTEARHQGLQTRPALLQPPGASLQTLQQRIVSLEAELRERDARLEEVRREAEARIEAIEADKREAIQTNVELRLALHAR